MHSIGVSSMTGKRNVMTCDTTGPLRLTGFRPLRADLSCSDLHGLLQLSNFQSVIAPGHHRDAFVRPQCWNGSLGGFLVCQLVLDNLDRCCSRRWAIRGLTRKLRTHVSP